MTAADPVYRPLTQGDVLGNVNPGQTITLFVSSAKASATDPLQPDLATEIASFEVARVTFLAGAGAVEITGDMSDLNPAGGAPDRDAFVRVRAVFDYTDGVQAALGPFASMDGLTITFDFNGLVP